MTVSISLPKNSFNNLIPLGIPEKLKQYRLDQTRQSLDKSILRAAQIVLRDYQPLPFTTLQWIWKLVNFYYLTHFTPYFMQVAAQKFAEKRQPHLAYWAWEKAKEEDFHDQLALRDIQALGYDPHAVITAFSNQATRLIDYFRQTVYAPDPIDCVGYSYAMERIAMSMRQEHIQAISDALPEGVKATRCIEVHSAIGNDASHVEDTIEVVAALSRKNRYRITQACKTASFLHFNTIKEYRLSEQKLKYQLEKLKL